VDDRALLLLCVLTVVPDLLVLLFRPAWLVFAPMWTVAERRFELRDPKQVERASGYRDGAVDLAPLPPLPARTEFADSVLFIDGERIALRRAFAIGRRETWLVRIDLVRDGDSLTLRARQVFTPMSIVIAGPLVGWTIAGPSLLMIGFPLLMVVVYGLQLAFSSAQRQAECEIGTSSDARSSDVDRRADADRGPRSYRLSAWRGPRERSPRCAS
jgi:hypothetical protein